MTFENLQILGTRGYLTVGNMYSNGKQIRIITSLGTKVGYKRIVDGVIEDDLKECKDETFEAWAKYDVVSHTWKRKNEREKVFN